MSLSPEIMRAIEQCEGLYGTLVRDGGTDLSPVYRVRPVVRRSHLLRLVQDGDHVVCEEYDGAPDLDASDVRENVTIAEYDGSVSDALSVWAAELGITPMALVRRIVKRFMRINGRL